MNEKNNRGDNTLSASSEMYLLYTHLHKNNYFFQFAAILFFSWEFIRHLGVWQGLAIGLLLSFLIWRDLQFSLKIQADDVSGDSLDLVCQRNIKQLENNSVFYALSIGGLIVISEYLNLYDNLWVFIVAMITMHVALLSTSLSFVGRAFQIQIGLIVLGMAIGLFYYASRITNFAFIILQFVFLYILISRAFEIKTKTLGLINKRLEWEQDKTTNFISRNEVFYALAHKVHLIESLSPSILTHLRVVMGQLKLFDRHIKLPAHRAQIDVAHKNARVVEQMLNGFFNAKKIIQDRVVHTAQAICLKDFIQDHLDVFAEQAKRKNISLKFDFDDESNSNVYIDADLFSQLISNLLSNAIKFTAEGGVYVELKIEHSTEFNDDIAKISIVVGDTGIGIAEEEIPHLFTRSSQASESNDLNTLKYGFGLQIVHKILTRYAQKGSVEIKSKVGVGTTVHVSFIAPRCDMRVTSRQGRAYDEAKLTGHVLVVDDTEIILKTTRKIIERVIGMTTTIALSGEEALRQVAVQRFDIIMMDCHMDGMSGFDAVVKIRELELKMGYARQALIMVSGDTSEESRKLAIQAGADAYLRKPHLPQELKELFVKLLPEKLSDASCIDGKDGNDSPHAS